MNSKNALDFFLENGITYDVILELQSPLGTKMTPELSVLMKRWDRIQKLEKIFEDEISNNRF